MLEAKDTLLLDQDSYLNRIADIKETLKKSEDTIKEFDKWMNEFKENSKKLGDIIDRVLAQRDFTKFLVDLQTGELIPKDEKLFEIME